MNTDQHFYVILFILLMLNKNFIKDPLIISFPQEIGLRKNHNQLWSAFIHKNSVFWAMYAECNFIDLTFFSGFLKILCKSLWNF